MEFMDLTNHTLQGLASLDLSADGGAKLRCEVSRAYEEAGDYERACAALGELWRRVGERPVVDGLAPDAAAEVLLQAGRLTSGLGSARQIDGAQEAAKNLISESAALFERLGSGKKVTEAQTELAVCYWREGGFDEARVMLKEALGGLSESDVELKAVALLRLALVERASNRYDAALEIYNEAAPLVEASGNDALRGKFHNNFADALENLGRAEGRPEIFDRALIEYAAASYHFELAGHARFRARVENNLGFLFNTIGRRAEAHEHLQRARALFAGLKEAGSVAQVDETRARVLIAEGRLEEAERVARSAVRGLEAGGPGGPPGGAVRAPPAESAGGTTAAVEERWAGFSLKREVLRYESELIERALADAGGVVSRAAKLLGFKHHQTFVALLNNRHKGLLHARRPIVPRRRSLVKVREPRRTAHHRADKEARVVTILFVEDNRVVADAIRDTLELEGWRVEACFDGASALKKVEGLDHFDLILLDEDLPGVSGLELTGRARRLSHRETTPIVIFSATNRETAAREAGADAFLRKPQDILALVPTITRLLDSGAAA